jgi:hypothetical protein
MVSNSRSRSEMKPQLEVETSLKCGSTAIRAHWPNPGRSEQNVANRAEQLPVSSSASGIATDLKVAGADQNRLKS